MTTYNTGNPLGSKDPRDLYDNAENLDGAMNGTASTWVDRFGRARPAWAGITAYQLLGPYAGGIEITGYNQLVLQDGEYWRLSAAVHLPFTTSGNWGADKNNFTPIGDALLRQELADKSSGAPGAALFGYAGGNVAGALDDLKYGGRPIVILSSGQSNMPQAIPYDWEPAQNLRLWNFSGNNQASDVVGTAFAAVDPAYVGPSLAAANVLARTYRDSPVYVINVYRGGLGLANWGPTPPEYNFRQAIAGNVAAALAAIGVSTVDYFLWGGCETDANAQSQTLQVDFETWLMGWLKTREWFEPFTPTFIFAMSPYAESQPGNEDYLWRRYNNALRDCVAVYPSARTFIDLDDLPISLFEGPTGLPGDIPYIHRTGEGYYKSGLKCGQAMLSGLAEPITREDNKEGLWTPAITNLVNCSAVVVSYAHWYRVRNVIHCFVRVVPTIVAASEATRFDIAVPILAKTFPNNTVGHITSANGDSGVVVGVPLQQVVQAAFTAKIVGISATMISFAYRVNSSDALPNPPPGTT